MNIECLPLGPLQANCYLVSEEGQTGCVVIDPGGEGEALLAHLQARGLSPALVVLTHGHVDHVAAARQLQQAGAKVALHPADREFVTQPHPFFAQMVGGCEPCTPDEDLSDGQTLTVAGMTLQVLHTPGHSLGSVCLVGEGCVFTGDTLFADSVGRTDLPGGNWSTLLQSLQRLITAVDPQATVYPGHGEATTIAEEVAHNPFLEELR